MKNCKQCQQEIEGRADKIFCSAICKSKAHRKINFENRAIKNTHNILLKNYKILDNVFTNSRAKQVTLTHVSLASKGFQFQYFTRLYKNKQGKYYRFIYNYKWMEFSDGNLIIYK